MEIWKDIKGYEGLYQVSNLGRVKSLNYRRTKKEKILKTKESKDGYLRVTLSNNKDNKIYFIHRLVAQTFLCNPYNHKEVNHKDENKRNNYVDNLEWCTRKYNINYGKRTLKTQKRIIQYDRKGNFIKEWNSISECDNKLNIAHQSICACCKGKRKTAGGYVWRYKDIV